MTTTLMSHWPPLRQWDTGPAMTPAPADKPLAWPVEWFSKGHGQVVVLEPGDATRYELTVAPLGYNRVLVARTESWYEPIGAVILDLRERVVAAGPEMQTLSRGNTWTTIVLAWWLNGFFSAVRERRGGRP